MKQAYVLINCNVGMEEMVEFMLNKFHDVKEICRVHGIYDIIAKVEASTEGHLQNTVAKKIRNIPNVRSSQSIRVKLKEDNKCDN